jgi:membrane protease YdiL (CAAX protease family)
MTENLNDSGYSRADFFKHLLVLVLIYLASSVLGQLVVLGLAANLGMANMMEALAEMEKGKFLELLQPLRLLLILMHAFSFLVPALVFALFFWRPKMQKNLYLRVPKKISYWPMALLFVVMVLPITVIIHYLNTLIPAAWQQNTGQELQKLILTMHRPTDLVMNLILVGAMAGVGEELLFRGVLQRLLGWRFQNIHVAVWLAAIAFSLVHFELQAFVPRALLGATFGYLAYWSGSLFVPIVLHFMYNSVQVVAVYFNPSSMEEKVTAPSLAIVLVAVAASAAYIFIGRWFAAQTTIEDKKLYLQAVENVNVPRGT